MVEQILKTTTGADGVEYYVIATTEDFCKFRDIVNGCSSQNSEANALLVADIDLNPGLNPTAEADRQCCKKWNSMGYYNGIFDGNGHTISGIYIDDSGSLVGLFEWINKDSIVKNLTIDRSFIKCTSTQGAAGGIAGDNAGKIISCTVQAGVYVNGHCYVGGVTGCNSGNITDCKTYSNVISEEYAGGIVGFSTGSMSGCKSYSTVSSKDGAGGLVGINFSVITSCENYGSVLGNEGNTGGLVGVLHSSLINSRNFTDGLSDCGRIEEDAVYIPYDAEEQLALSDEQTFGEEIAW